MSFPFRFPATKRRRLQTLMGASLLLLALLLCCREQLESCGAAVGSYAYRRLVNDFSFLAPGMAVSRQEARRFNDFPYLLDHPDACSREDQDVFLLIAVKSAPGNAGQRDAIRSTWGNETHLRRLTQGGAAVKVLFFLGTPGGGDASAVQEALEREDRLHGDLIQRDFVDSYRNLTLKLLSQLGWARRSCARARFLMTADDDVLVHTPNLLRHLRDAERRNTTADLWLGRVYRGAPAVRNEKLKHYVSRDTYPWSTYPDFMPGTGYVLSRDAAEKVHRAALGLNATIFIDDVFMGICAHVAGVKPQHHVYFAGAVAAPRHPCVYRRMMTSHGHRGSDMHALWEEATDPRVQEAGYGWLGEAYCKALELALLCLP